MLMPSLEILLKKCYCALLYIHKVVIDKVREKGVEKNSFTYEYKHLNCLDKLYFLQTKGDDVDFLYKGNIN